MYLVLEFPLLLSWSWLLVFLSWEARSSRMLELDMTLNKHYINPREGRRRLERKDFWNSDEKYA